MQLYPRKTSLTYWIRELKSSFKILLETPEIMYTIDLDFGPHSVA